MAPGEDAAKGLWRRSDTRVQSCAIALRSPASERPSDLKPNSTEFYSRASLLASPLARPREVQRPIQAVLAHVVVVSARRLVLGGVLANRYILSSTAGELHAPLLSVLPTSHARVAGVLAGRAGSGESPM